MKRDKGEKEGGKTKIREEMVGENTKKGREGGRNTRQGQGR